MCVRTMARSSHQAPSVTPAERKNDTLHSALLSAWHFHCLLNKGWRGRKIEIACSEVSKRKYFQYWREDNNLFVRSMLVHRQSLQNKRAFTRQDEQRWEDKLEILFQTCYTVTFIFIFFVSVRFKTKLLNFPKESKIASQGIRVQIYQLRSSETETWEF